MLQNIKSVFITEKRRMLALVLSFCMFLTMLPITAAPVFAADNILNLSDAGTGALAVGKILSGTGGTGFKNNTTYNNIRVDLNKANGTFSGASETLNANGTAKSWIDEVTLYTKANEWYQQLL